MKKLLFVLFSVVFLFSCSEPESAKDIDINKIDNACDFVDAVGVVYGEMIDLTEEYKDVDEEEIPESAFKKMEFLEAKLNEIESITKYKWIDKKYCPNFKEVDDNMQKIDDIEQNLSKLQRGIDVCTCIKEAQEYSQIFPNPLNHRVFETVVKKCLSDAKADQKFWIDYLEDCE